MLVLTALFIGLGMWQMRRLEQKETKIAAVELRLGADPVALPPLAEWRAFDAAIYDFRPVTLTGQFNHSETILVFTSLPTTNGKFNGPGYWVVVPFNLQDGGTLFVNRGFVPEARRGVFAQGGEGEDALVSIEGLARRSEGTNLFTPGPDRFSRIEYVRNISRLTEMVDLGQGPFLPIYVDQFAASPGSLPQGGETVVSFPNRHFEYALTWFALAILTPLMLVVWVLRQRAARAGK